VGPYAYLLPRQKELGLGLGLGLHSNVIWKLRPLQIVDVLWKLRMSSLLSLLQRGRVKVERVYRPITERIMNVCIGPSLNAS